MNIVGFPQEEQSNPLGNTKPAVDDISLCSDTDTESGSDRLNDTTSTFHTVQEIETEPVKHGLTVIGLYGRAPVPRSEQLPKDYTLKDMAPDQFMPRRRLNTKPLYEDFDKSIMSGQDSDDDHNDDNAFDEAMFIPVHGLVNNTFWHVQEDSKSGLFEDRAILFQAVEHYDKLAQEPRFASCFDDYLSSPYFGEQVIVKGYDSSQLSVGDVFAVENDLSSLVVEITSPRKPCYYVDKRNGTSMGAQGMRRHTLTEGLAGWFARVVVAGELRDGMKLVRTKHPNPKWTLTYLSKVLYGEGNKAAMLTCKATWGREKEELTELLNLPQLGEFEWKDELREILRNLEKNKGKQSRLSLFGVMRRKPVEFKVKVRGIYGHNEEVEEIEVDEEGVIEIFSKMQRDRYIMKSVSEKRHEDDEEAFFVPNRGLMWETFWHVSKDKINGGRVHGDRAVLFQSVEHYEKLANHPKFASCFDGGKYDYISNPTFGEQVIVEGCDASQIAVGDVFEVEGKLSPLVVEITSPRKPGDKVDMNHHSKVMGYNGIKHYCLTNGLAGWFTRVLVAGELRDGMKLVRTKNPNPKWTLTYISDALYSEGDTAYWNREKDELVELVNLPQLGEVQWKEDGVKLFRNVDEEHDQVVEEKSSEGYLSWFVSAAGCYCNAFDSLTACGPSLIFYD